MHVHFKTIGLYFVGNYSPRNGLRVLRKNQPQAEQNAEQGDVSGGFSKHSVQFLSFVDADHVLPSIQVGEQK